jgi:S1-C subfamily serine protease
LLVTASGVNYKTFAVANVAPNSPASFAGLKKGDIIEGVDTDPAADLTLLTLRDLFIQVGHKYKVTYQRDNQIKDVTIQMRRYL